MKSKILALLLLAALRLPAVIIDSSSLTATSGTDLTLASGSTTNKVGTRNLIESNRNAATISVFGASDAQTGLRIIGSDGVQSTLLSHSFGNANNVFAGFSASGTGAMPTTMLSGTGLRLMGGGYNGSGYVGRAEIDLLSSENWTSTANGTTIIFLTTANGTALRRTVGSFNDAGNLNVTVGDVEVETISKGIILKSPNGNRWRITVDNTGALVTTAL